MYPLLGITGKLLKVKRELLDGLHVRLGHKSMDDWYTVTGEDIEKYGGNRLLRYFNGSIPVALAVVYPEHNWMMWRFKTIPKLYLNLVLTNQQEAGRMMGWLGEKLSIKNLHEWYKVSSTELYQWSRMTRSMLISLLKVA